MSETALTYPASEIATARAADSRPKLVSLDSETYAIQPGLLTPTLVCGSVATWEEPEGRLLTAEGFRERMKEALLDRDSTIVGAHIAYDLGVLAAEDPAWLPLIFAAYEQDRIHDVLIGQALEAIAGGHLGKEPDGSPLMYKGRKTDSYNLDTCMRLTFGFEDAKKHDFWRVRYAILSRLSQDQWPTDARRYPCDDVAGAFLLAAAQLGLIGVPNKKLAHDSEVQEGFVFGACSKCGLVPETPGERCLKEPDILPPTPFRNIENMPDQTRAALSLYFGSIWGLRTDKKRVKALAKPLDDAHEATLKRFTGIFIRGEGAKKGTEDTSSVKKAVAVAYGVTGTCSVCAGAGRVAGTRAPKLLKNGAVSKAKVPTKGCQECCGTGLNLKSVPTLPRTDKNDVSTNRDVLEESGDDTLMEYALIGETEKLRDTYMPVFWEGTRGPLNPQPNVLLETGRTSYRGLFQTFPRKAGVREVFRARDGYVYCSTDYGALELCTLAQCCLWIVGYSRMAQVINETGDPGSLHTMLAASMVGVSFDEMKRLIKSGDKDAKNKRQAAKPAGFGFPGGMGAAKLVLTNRKRGTGTTPTLDGEITYAGIRFCILMEGARRCGETKVTEWARREIPPTCLRCIMCAEDLKKAWHKQWPEMREYFNFVSHTVDNDGEVKQFISERVRGGVNFTAASNGFFQGLAADGAKHSLWLVTRECYSVPESPLYGTRAPIFAHDEIFSEMLEAKAHLAGPRQAELMLQGMKTHVPDVALSCIPALMRYWSKDAETVYDADGRLIVWGPKCKQCGKMQNEPYEHVCGSGQVVLA